MQHINLTNFRKDVVGVLEQVASKDKTVKVSTETGNVVLLSEAN